MRQGENLPENLVQNIHLNMRSMRGSNAYWQNACSNLIAMVKNLGPPTWFLTLSCNDLNWDDMLKALLISAGRPNESPSNLSFSDRQKLVEDHPVTLSRQFMIRVNAFMRFLKNDHHVLGGKLVDFWWRIEFQNRGSPHLHMLCWIENAPHFDTPEGRSLINETISCSLNNDDDELNEIVKRVQIHNHSSTCYKKRNDLHCRFNFPRPVSDQMTLLGPDETIRNNGRFCILKRSPAEQYVNNYNPQILKLWRANMDIQACGNVTAVSYYIAKYTSKHEPQDVGQAVKDAVSRVRASRGDIGRQLFAVSMAILNHRRVSACECAYRLCHLKLRDSSRKVVFVNTCRPHERYRILRYDSDHGQTYQNIFDKYVQRPDSLEHLSLAEFAVNYEHVTRSTDNEDDGDAEAYDNVEEGVEAAPTTIRLLNGSVMKKRTKPAILRTRYYTQMGDREGYFYSYLVAHVPFRNENILMAGYETCEEAFMAHRHELRPFHGDSVEQFQYIERELQQVIGQVLALADNSQFDDANGNDRDKNADNHNIGAIVDGYDPRVADVDIEIEEVGDELHINITDEEFHAMVSSMNVDQRRIFDEVTKRIRNEITKTNENVPLKLFVTGGAGCGKTFVLKTIVQHIRRCYAPTTDLLLNATFVEVTAPTGVAARLINGKTIHSALCLGIEKGKATVYRQMTGQRLEDMRRKWRHIRWLIIDEISMVSYEVLRSIHLRLQELKNCNDIFGGVNIIIFGDIMQLSPVKGSWCFQQPFTFQGEPHLWRYFGLCELKTNVRQQNDCQFIDILNHLRVGELSMEQYEILLERSRVPLIGDFADGEAVRIFPTVKLVNDYNEKMVELMARTVKIYTLHAHDESKEPATYGEKPNLSSIPQDPNCTGGLVSSIKIAIGARVMLRMNLKVSEGLVNGSMGIIKKLEWNGLRRDQLEEGELPKLIFIEFDDKSIGRSFKEENGWVPIQPQSLTFQGLKGYGNIERIMFPFILSWAVTVHKLQGTTVEKAVVYLGKKTFAKGQAYVALSRVKSLQGVAICELDQRKLFNCPHDKSALEELQRIRNPNKALSQQ
ncbi:hypothetical protein MSG28_014329 [Choristoneura fumiferana]|uniref:Uncharacterized protein n=1 Tax=Choristoneura fumiferana TaxID=7141 RepID=A0ACC0JGT8_CHOFU|nr:hypothetical protein MSG28_014329 [Choristoneura fumiferana]